MRIFFFFIFGITLFGLITACATPQSLQHTHEVQVIDDVPFFPQDDYQCGPASLASVISFWNDGVSPAEIAEEIFRKSVRGTVTIDMILYAQRKGFHAEQFRGSIAAIRDFIDAGIPLIVLVDYGISVFQRNHFMVVTGYTREGVIVHSGRSQNKILPEKDFLNAWKKTDYWTLLLKKP